VMCLIKPIKQITYKLEEITYHLLALHNAKMRLFSLRQGKDVTNDKFLETFQTHVSVIEQFRGEIGRDTIIISKELEIRGLSVKDVTEAQIAESSNTGKGKYLATALIRASYRSRYVRMLDDLQNQYLNGYNNYSDSVTAAYHLLTHYVVNPQSTARIINNSEGVAFATVDVNVASTKRNLKVKFFQCNKMGHFANYCPENEGNTKGGKKAEGEVTAEALQQLVLADPPGRIRRRGRIQLPAAATSCEPQLDPVRHWVNQ
jgi:hypothetical protein